MSEPTGLTEDAADPGRLEALGSRPLSIEESDRLADLFRILGDANRTRMLYALLEAGELRVGDLAAAVGAAESSVSHALRLLRTAGIVRKRREGRMAFYSLDDVHVRLLLELSREHLGHGPGQRR